MDSPKPCPLLLLAALLLALAPPSQCAPALDSPLLMAQDSSRLAAAAGPQPHDRRLLQGAAPPPANCSAPGDTWAPPAIDCTLGEGFDFSCTYQRDTNNALCHIQGPLPTQLIGMTCPVKSGRAVCDLVVAQNFVHPDVVFSVAALLVAWSPGP